MPGKNVHEMSLGSPLVDTDEFYVTRSPYGVGNDARIPATDIPEYVDEELAVTSGLAAKLDKTGGTMSGAITLHADPASALHAATKQYVDAQVVAAAAGLDWKDPVRAATTAAISLSGEQTIDGVAVVAGDRVLVKNQASGTAHGIYVVAVGAWARSSDANTSAEVSPGMFAIVQEGTVNGDTGWFLTTNGPIVLETTVLTFALFKMALTDGEVTDAKIGNRTVDDTAALGSDTGLLGAILSGIGNLIKGITGKSTWRTAPRTTLENAVKLDGDTMTGALALPSARFSQTAITYAATTTLDFSVADEQTLTLTGNVTFDTSNRAAGRSKTVKINPGASSRTITYPSWVPIGAALPTTFAASKIVILTLKCWGSDDTDITAAVGAQP